MRPTMPSRPTRPRWRQRCAAALRLAVGVLEFDQKGDIKNPVYDIYVWKDGKSFPTTKWKQQ